MIIYVVHIYVNRESGNAKAASGVSQEWVTPWVYLDRLFYDLGSNSKVKSAYMVAVESA